jgi:predicted secreted Zn-dependent protease
VVPSIGRRRRAGWLLVALCAVSILGLLSADRSSRSEPREPVALILAERGAGPGGPADATAPDAGDSPVALAPAPASAELPPVAADEQATAAIPDSVHVTTSSQYYAVEGASISSLLTSLRRHGPSDGSGTWAASTGWVFRWSYQPIADPACRVASAHVELELTGTYPQWDAPDGVAPAVSTAWSSYLTHVELHEHGHQQIAERAAADLVRTLETLPAQTSCDTLAASARATAADLLARHAEAQAAYDRETGHGATQGAVLSE